MGLSERVENPLAALSVAEDQAQYSSVLHSGRLRNKSKSGEHGDHMDRERDMKHLGLISVILIVCAFTVSCSKGSGSSQSVADAGPVVMNLIAARTRQAMH